ncbi:MAG: aminodeoxychorismate/anthranilate synthase component II [Clostridiales bacterium]|nr:aminodeoxychorismate/anthranilate synthase component II [Clostridiales bacterium]
MVLLIDNYDSFSYNLYQLIGSVEPEIKVIRNDEMTVEEIDDLSPEAIFISPGPGRPEDAGVCIDVIKRLGDRYPILGVCLGHQAICAAYGATVTYAKELMHGKQSVITVSSDCDLFNGLFISVPVARYHSLAADPATMPEDLQVTAVTDEGEVMAVKHKEYQVYGVQFHPESIMTPDGKKMMENFINIARNMRRNQK